MTDCIHLEGLLLRTIIGLNEWERERRQDVVIDLHLFRDLHDPGGSDAEADILNYRTVAKDVIHHVEASHHYLLESLATDIARICVVDHGAERVIVRVDKPGAVRFARTVGVEIERTAADFAAGG
jgi:FolB domain-containing protein